MGVCLAVECANLGAKVKLILGPSSLDVIHSNIQVIRVESANDMFSEVKNNFNSSDIAIFSAAVSDYSVINIATNKIKKSEKTLKLDLQKNIDILLEMSIKKTDQQFIVGFALETENEFENAKRKLVEKNLDMIVLNSLNDEGAGFNCNTNKITIIDKQENFTNFDVKEKHEVAKDIVLKILELNI